ncbi:MAG: hypothetical protein J5477_01900 [Schwartzia sp.]|nr:hypothetical protein [Schwartzia sp. (in: firmicutes)]
MQLKKWLCALLAFSLLAAASIASAKEPVSWDDPPDLTLTAQSDYQWTGVAVSPAGRLFVCFPAWGNHPNYHVGEILNGAVYPYYEVEDNASFISVESVFADATNTLWILDTGRRPNAPVDPVGVRLFMVNLATNQIARTYTLPSDVVLPDTTMSDVRVDNARGAAYLSDSGHGGVIVLDLASGHAWRALTDIPEVCSNLQSIYFPTGLFTKLANCNGLELSKDKKLLYFCSLGSDVLYSVPTDALLDESLSVAQRQALIKAVNVKNVPTDGMVLRDNSLFMGALSNEGVWEFQLDLPNVAEAGALLNLGKDIRWADSFALAADNSIYFTTSAINYPPGQQAPYELYHMVWPEKSSQARNPNSGK